jgi:transposase-like protein
MEGRRRHSPEQIVRKLREADRLLGQGQKMAAVLKHLEISQQTLHRWRKVYGEMTPEGVSETLCKWRGPSCWGMAPAGKERAWEQRTPLAT